MASRFFVLILFYQQFLPSKASKAVPYLVYQLFPYCLVTYLLHVIHSVHGDDEAVVDVVGGEHCAEIAVDDVADSSGRRRGGLHC